MKRLLTYFLFSLVSIAQLTAGGWGKTDKTTLFQGETWNDVYFDMDGLYLSASVPNYAGASMVNSGVAIKGKKGGNIWYQISTTMGTASDVPNSESGFVKLIEDANPDHTAKAIDPKPSNARFALEITPKKGKDPIFARFFATKNRLIQVATNDPDAPSRERFFNSVSLRRARLYVTHKARLENQLSK